MIAGSSSFDPVRNIDFYQECTDSADEGFSSFSNKPAHIFTTKFIPHSLFKTFFHVNKLVFFFFELLNFIKGQIGMKNWVLASWKKIHTLENKGTSIFSKETSILSKP